MTDSKREAALKALHLALANGLPGQVVKRNAPEGGEIPDGGLVTLRDGEPGPPEAYLSPPAYAYVHEVPVVVLVQNREAEARDAAVDAILRAIGQVLAGDETLGGMVESCRPGAPEFLDEPVDGAETIKATVVPVYLDYTTSSPLL